MKRKKKRRIEYRKIFAKFPKKSSSDYFSSMLDDCRIPADMVHEWGLDNNNRRKRHHIPMVRKGCSHYKDIISAKRSKVYIIDTDASERAIFVSTFSNKYPKDTVLGLIPDRYPSRITLNYIRALYGYEEGEL